MRKAMWTTLCGAAAVALLLALAHARAQKAGLNGADGGVAEDTSWGSATLYALDPLARSFCFGDGRHGSVVQGGEVRNRCSDIDFGNYEADSFSVGVEGARNGSIVDLGGSGDLSRRYGYAETVGGGQGFASLAAEGSRVRILKDRKDGTFQDLTESALLFKEGRGRASAPVRLGNIYLVRLTDRHDKSFQRLVKFQVVAHTPNQSVTIRWQRL
jgi:hypothetical protein